ncbi:MAG TPA: hypothetical protein VN087_12375 [Verrucomicrobiae bacterium]|jgi:hypothetical protein|nr:hypothetical protein [Verrucomicrobiae bacterium]
MKLRFSNIFPGVRILCIAAAVFPASIRAQAPAGPLPAAPPQASPSPAAGPQNQPARAETRTSILGRWKLNLDESDDPRKKLEDARTSRGSGPRTGNGVSIAGFPIGGHGGNRGGESEEEQQRTQIAIAPANSLALAQKDSKDPEVDLTDDLNRKRALFTDGRKVQKPDPKDDSYGEIAAHWDGSRLVTDEKGPRGGKMSRTFELSYDGAQLYETLRLTVGRSNTPVDIRYVYEPVPASAAPANP